MTTKNITIIHSRTQNQKLRHRLGIVYGNQGPIEVSRYKRLRGDLNGLMINVLNKKISFMLFHRREEGAGKGDRSTKIKAGVFYKLTYF